MNANDLPFKNVLVVIDSLEEKQPVLVQAVHWAEQNHAQLKIVDVVRPFPWATSLLLGNAKHMEELLAKEKGERLQRLAEPLRRRGLPVKTKVLMGRTSVEVVRQVLRHKYDLVIRSAKGPHSHRRGFFGTTAIELLRKCPCAVWLVGPNAAPAHPKIVAAVDATPDDEGHARLNARILETAKFVSSVHQGRLDVAFVWNIYGEKLVKDYMKAGEFAEMERTLEIENKESFERLLAEFGMHAASENAHMLRGSPVHELSRFTQEHGTDLLVLGTVARRGISGLLMGNTSEMLLNELQTSVLALKPEGFVSPIRLFARKIRTQPAGSLVPVV